MRVKLLLVAVVITMSCTKPNLVSIPLKRIEVAKPSLEVQLNLEENHVNHEELLLQTKKHCEQLLEDAKQQKAMMLEAVKQEVEQIKVAAYEDAKQKGYEDGLTEGKIIGHQQVMKEATAAMNELKQHCQLAKEACATYIDDTIDDLLQVIRRVVEKVTYQVFENLETGVLPLLQEQLKELGRRQQIFIRIHPNSFESVKTQEEELLKYCREAKVHFISDLTLDEFGCVIETENEIVDLQLNKQLDLLFAELERVVRES